jgi:hypothetical protein
MPVPKASVHEDNTFVFRQHDVWPTRQALLVEAEAIAKTMKHAAHEHLGCCVLPANSAHIPAAVLSCQAVAHVDL